jgi:hypothetical protein
MHHNQRKSKKAKAGSDKSFEFRVSSFEFQVWPFPDVTTSPGEARNIRQKTVESFIPILPRAFQTVDGADFDEAELGQTIWTPV